MATITAMGMGSGLDIAGLVSQLVKAEGGPVTQRLDRQQRQASAELSALGSLKSALASLQTSLKGLADANGARPMSASSSHEALFSAVADGQAVGGQYQLEIVRLAQRHKLGTELIDKGQTFGGAAGDQLTIATGGAEFTLDLATAKTLAEIRDAINRAADNPGVTASLLRVDADNEILVLSAADTGQANAVTVTETFAGGPSLGLTTANRDAAGKPLTDLAELDALIRIDGIEIARTGNQLADVLDGVRIELGQAEPGTLAALEVVPDHQADVAAIKGFVDQYNALMDTLGRLAGFRGVGAEQPPLYGDAAARGLGSRLRTELSRSADGSPFGQSGLAEIGIQLGSDGKLTLDAGKLESALAADRDGVSRVFGSEEGLATRLGALLEAHLQRGGILDTRTDGLKGRLDRIAGAREALERRLEVIETRYRQQFLAMDVLVGRLQNTSSFLSQQLTALNSIHQQAR
ncbi:flagellar filament capping protein FliD [Thioalkalicoccus limnaeus]|uniref:Flagellar hook-associated protein 2 n=1 Tax=Thioalkalicoccus limnaeus TaxID=120681 RepID=A0ABV4BBN6_9GAMM